VLERIGADGLPPGLEITETHVNGPERRNSLAYDFSWPSKRPGFRGIRPVRGYSLGRAPRGAQLIYVMRADEPGIYAFDGVVVDYRVGSRHYRARIANGLKACILPAGVKRDIDRCPPG
jgi:hypothetical protein